MVFGRFIDPSLTVICTTLIVFVSLEAMFSNRLFQKVSKKLHSASNEQGKTGEAHQSPPHIHTEQQSQQQPLALNTNINDKFISGLYFANWAIYSKKHTPQDIPYELVTNIFYSFIDVVPQTGELKLSDPWADIQIPIKHGPDGKSATGNLELLYQLKQKYRHLKVSMSVGGWSFKEHFAQGVSDEAKLNRFVDSAIQFLLEYGFDGIDLDWEYPSNKFEGQQYVLLVKKLRQRLDKVEKSLAVDDYSKPSLLLTIAVPAMPSSLQHFNVREIDRYISFWNLMTYDFAGAWSDTAQHQSNLYPYKGGEWSASQSVDLFTGPKYGIDPKKLVLGMPLYGRRFLNTNGLNNPFRGVGDNDGIVDYKNIIGQFSDLYDDTAVAGYTYDTKLRTFLSYENRQSSMKKAVYVAEKRLGGGMWWESSGDIFNDQNKGVVLNFIQQLGGPQALEALPNNLNYPTSKYLHGQD